MEALTPRAVMVAQDLRFLAYRDYAALAPPLAALGCVPPYLRLGS